jgi:hypothetical protein
MASEEFRMSMQRYLYIFAYQTPAQAAFSDPGEAEEFSAAVFVEAKNPQEALDWGREISEKFVADLFGPGAASWRSKGFDHWVESQPEKEYPPHVLAGVPVVQVGTYPDL